MTPSEFARGVLQADLQPWQVQLLDRVDRDHVFAATLLRGHGARHDAWAARAGAVLGSRHDLPAVLDRQPDGSFAFRQYARLADDGHNTGRGWIRRPDLHHYRDGRDDR